MTADDVWSVGLDVGGTKIAGGLVRFPAGEVVARRSDVWRLYDLFWRIHILDFEAGENFNHPLIIGAARR